MTHYEDTFRSCQSDSHRWQAHAPGPRYEEEETIRNDISETAETPGAARCNANQPVQVDQTTLVR